MPISPLAKKLQISPNDKILLLNAPSYFRPMLSDLPEGAEIVETSQKTIDCVHLFVQTAQELQTLFPTAVAQVKPDGLFWISYPKRSSKVATDLTRDQGWDIVDRSGWRPVRQVAIDDTWSALRFRPKEHKSEDALIAAQYQGAKADLLPIFERVISSLDAIGSDYELAPRKTYVAFTRKRQFAVIQPSTRTRVDLGLKLPDAKAGERLLEAGHLGSGSITHKVELFKADDVDEEVKTWLRTAYELAAN